jgi:nitroreductase
MPSTPETLLDVIFTQRTVRRFRPDPVDPALLHTILRAATCAPNARNQQAWRFLVVTDAATRAQIGRLYAEGFMVQHHAATLAEARADLPDDALYREVFYLAEHFGEVPVHILVGHNFASSFDPGSSIYPACQNLMLAAWALGLGSIFTTIWLRREAEMRALLAVPAGIQLVGLIGLGWPARAYKPPRRRPVEEVAYLDRWGAGFKT